MYPILNKQMRMIMRGITLYTYHMLFRKTPIPIPNLISNYKIYYNGQKTNIPPKRYILIDNTVLGYNRLVQLLIL